MTYKISTTKLTDFCEQDMQGIMGNKQRQTFDKDVSSHSLCLKTDGFSTVKTLFAGKVRGHKKSQLLLLQLFKFHILSPSE